MRSYQALILRLQMTKALKLEFGPISMKQLTETGQQTTSSLKTMKSIPFGLKCMINWKTFGKCSDKDIVRKMNTNTF